MKARIVAQFIASLTIVAVVFFALTARGLLPSIPEPGLIIYGSVVNTNLGSSRLLAAGMVNWVLSGHNSTSAVPSTIVDVNGQYFYIAKVPFETRAVGSDVFLPTPNVLSLSPVTLNYRRDATVNGSNAVIAFSSRGNLATFPFGGAIRGQVERVDLQVNLARESFADWALRLFGTTNVNANADADADGVNNQNEYLAGTDPNESKSLFILTSIAGAPGGGIDVRWQSVNYKTYSLLRSSNVSTGYATIQAGIAARPPTNTFHDATAIGPGPYFYRAKLETPDLPVSPTLPFKLVEIQPHIAGGIEIRWESVANRTYSIYRSTNVAQGFINLQAFLPATPGTNTFRDATVSGLGPYFYRVRLD